jgi:hypothetical protein
MRGISKETTGIQTGNDSSNKIIERFTKIIHGEEIKPEVKPEVIQEDTPYYKNKYIIIAGLLILAGITWYFYDDIRPVGSSLLAWINVLKSRKGDPDSGTADTQANSSNNQLNSSNNPVESSNIEGEVQVDSRWNLNKLKNWTKEKIYGKPKDEDINEAKQSSENSSIKLGEPSKTEEMDHYFPEPSKGKAVDLRNLSQTELERRGIDSQMTGLSEISGNPGNFWREGEILKREIKTFTEHYEEDKFPRTELAQATYNLISRRIDKWIDANPELYQQFIQYDFNNRTLENFRDLHADVNLIAQSETYKEAEKAASEEKDIWSDRGNSPQQILSPELVAETAIETIEKDKNIPKLVIDNVEKVAEITDKEEPITPSKKELDNYWDNLKTKAKKIWNNNNISILEENELLSEDAGPNDNTEKDIANAEDLSRKNEPTLEIWGDKDNTKIETSKNTTPEEMNDYFVKEESNKTVEETKITEESKIEINHSKELDNLAKTLTPKIKDNYIEIDNAKVFENLDPNLLPENPKTRRIDSKDQIISAINIIKDNQKTEGLFSQETTSQIKDTLSKENEILYSKDNINKTLEERPHIVEALKAIKSKRLEYGSPSVANIGLPKGDLSPLIQNENISNLPDIKEEIDLEENKNYQDKLPLHNWKEEIKFNINKGQPYERFIDIELGENQKDIYKILIITNDGMSNSINPNTVISHSHKNSFKWDIKGSSNSYWRELDIYSISIIDKSRVSQEIYRNNNIKFLKVFKDNITKSFR